MHLDSRALCSLGLGLALAGGVLLGVFGSLLIRPYTYTKDFDKVTCSVQSSSIMGNVCCVVGVSMDQCSQWYPCLRIAVSYSANGVVEDDGILYRDYETAMYQENGSCSLFHCPVRSYSEGHDAVTQFQANYGSPGQNLTCHRDPDRVDEVVMEVISTNQLINGLLWPCIALVLGLVMASLAQFGALPCAREEMGKEDAAPIIIPDEVKDFTPPGTPSFSEHGSRAGTPAPSGRSSQEPVVSQGKRTVVAEVPQDIHPNSSIV